MPSMVVPASLSATLTTLTFLQSQKPFLKPVKISFSTNSNPCFSAVHDNSYSNRRPRSLKLAASSVAEEEASIKEDFDEETHLETPPDASEKLGVLVKPLEKPRLMLRFIWMEKNIGIALDQMVPGYGSIPLSPYYFWPRKDAWEELKELLESKPWISQKQMIILLNQATDIINLWQQGGGNLA